MFWWVEIESEALFIAKFCVALRLHVKWSSRWQDETNSPFHFGDGGCNAWEGGGDANGGGGVLGGWRWRWVDDGCGDIYNDACLCVTLIRSLTNLWRDDDVSYFQLRKNKKKFTLLFTWYWQNNLKLFFLSKWDFFFHFYFHFFALLPLGMSRKNCLPRMLISLFKS